MLVVRVLLFYVLLVSVLQAIQQHYDDGQSYAASGIVLGDPIQVDNGFLQRNQDTAHLQNMNDTILSEQGSDAYKNQTSDEESKARKTVAKQTSDNIFASGQKAQTTHLALQTDRGNLLTLSEHGKIDATQEHKIDPKNQLYKHSFAMESSPLNETGGIEITSKNKMAKNTDHTCEEGVQFKVDVINQLTYVPPPLVNYQQQVKYTGNCHHLL